MRVTHIKEEISKKFSKHPKPNNIIYIEHRKFHRKDRISLKISEFKQHFSNYPRNLRVVNSSIYFSSLNN